MHIRNSYLKMVLRAPEGEGAGGEGGDPVTPAIPQRPESVGEAHWDADTGRPNEDFYGHYNDLASQSAQAAERTASLPKDADGYEIAIPEMELPEGLPEGFALELKDDDARIPLLKAFAHENGLTQDQVAGLLKIEGQRQIAQIKADMAAHDQTLKDLGPSAKSRIDSVQAWMQSKMGEVPPVMDAMLADASCVRALEKLRTSFAGSTDPGTGGKTSILPPNAKGADHVAAAFANKG